jgi:simple sugar transport system ATP-binding protein
VTDRRHATIGPAGERAGRTVVATRGVSKRFGSTVALDDVNFSVAPGESRALVGRNGAGKSTLVSVLTGMTAPDQGEVSFADEPAPKLRDRVGWTRRVACVYQRPTIVPTLSVAENIMLRSPEVERRGIVNWKAMRRRAAEALEEWDLQLDVTASASTLTVDQRQIMEIARALVRGARFIILDEPTAELEGREIRKLFARLAALRSQGVTFIYISHHLAEIYEVCSSVTVLRDGAVVAESSLDEMPRERVVDAMVGGGRQLGAIGRRDGGDAHREARPVLSLRGLQRAGRVEDLDLDVGAGECVGLAGLAGSGTDEIADVVAGLLRPDAGEVSVDGEPVRLGSVARAQKHGIAYVPRDRHARGMVSGLSVAENVTMSIPDRLGRFGIVEGERRTQAAQTLIDDLDIKVGSSEQPISDLSGGNQQKAVVARALALAPRVLVLVSPTSGVDVAAKDALYGIIDAARMRGLAVLLVSDELDELRLCDRVCVVFKGRLTREFPRGWDGRELVSSIEGLEARMREATP